MNNKMNLKSAEIKFGQALKIFEHSFEVNC